MNTTNIITAVISDSNFAVASPILKEDKGLRLKIKGAALPATYEVDFSLNRERGESVTMIGDGRGVEIPEYLIKTGKDIYAFLYWVGEDYSRTVYIIKIPNKSRPDRTDITPEPAQQSVIDQTIEKLNEAVEHAPKIGEDGFWYVWDPEEADYVSTGQKAQGKQGDKGDTGNSGVYIGEDEPEDEDVDVWIEPDGEPDELPEPLKYVKDAPSDNGGVVEGDVAYNVASGANSHAEGSETTASGDRSHAEGGMSKASASCAHAEGCATKAKGANAHAEGNIAEASGACSHAEGNAAIASGASAHAEGSGTTASAENAHAEGGGTTASGQQAHAEGSGTTARGADSHAEGTGSQATNQAAHASGVGTIANKVAQTAIGKFNAEDSAQSSEGEYVIIVGNGTSAANRSNAFAMKWDGTMVLANGTEITPAQFAALLALLGS